jgi:hypothetical protein
LTIFFPTTDGIEDQQVTTNLWIVEHSAGILANSGSLLRSFLNSIAAHRGVTPKKYIEVFPHLPPHDHRTEFLHQGKSRPASGAGDHPRGSKPRSASKESRIPTANAARIVNAKRSTVLGPDGTITGSAGSSDWPAANLTMFCATTASRSSATTPSRAAANSAFRRPSLANPLR